MNQNKKLIAFQCLYVLFLLSDLSLLNYFLSDMDVPGMNNNLLLILYNTYILHSPPAHDILSMNY